MDFAEVVVVVVVVCGQPKSRLPLKNMSNAGFAFAAGSRYVPIGKTYWKRIYQPR